MGNTTVGIAILLTPGSAEFALVHSNIFSHGLAVDHHVLDAHLFRALEAFLVGVIVGLHLLLGDLYFISSIIGIQHHVAEISLLALQVCQTLLFIGQAEVTECQALLQLLTLDIHPQLFTERERRVTRSCQTIPENFCRKAPILIMKLRQCHDHLVKLSVGDVKTAVLSILTQ